MIRGKLIFSEPYILLKYKGEKTRQERENPFFHRRNRYYSSLFFHSKRAASQAALTSEASVVSWLTSQNMIPPTFLSTRPDIGGQAVVVHPVRRGMRAFTTGADRKPWPADHFAAGSWHRRPTRSSWARRQTAHRQPDELRGSIRTDDPVAEAGLQHPNTGMLIGRVSEKLLPSHW